ncbi:unnamed protein product, partial [Mesorhabditis belari]|uniref:Uncharacterized protein n=1 Tax=Mesorhabditis belari TaxID=2138241 RepID=A0AAF3FPA2_9BILA
MNKPPRHVFVENVVGFETSTVHADLLECLRGMGYGVKEYILSPMQFGIPNTRPRYYCLTSLQSSSSHSTSTILKTHKSCVEEIAGIEDFIEKGVDNSSLILDYQELNRFASSIDAVSSNSRRSACFTKSYGVYKTGCGSYFYE